MQIFILFITAAAAIIAAAGAFIRANESQREIDNAAKQIKQIFETIERLKKIITLHEERNRHQPSAEAAQSTKNTGVPKQRGTGRRRD